MKATLDDYLQNGDVFGFLEDMRAEAKNGDPTALRMQFYFTMHFGEPQEMIEGLDRVVEAAPQSPDFSFYAFLKNLWTLSMNKMSEEKKADAKKLKKDLVMWYDLSLATMRNSLSDVVLVDDMFENIRRPFFRVYNYSKEDFAAPVFPANGASLTVDVPEETRRYWQNDIQFTDDHQPEYYYLSAKPYAEQGDPQAMYIIGRLLAHGVVALYNVPEVSFVLIERNDELAQKWFEAAAEAGFVQAYVPSGNATLIQRGWEENKDRRCLDWLFEQANKAGLFEQAFPYLEQLAEIDNESALLLAEWYSEGKGTPQNEVKAFEIYEKLYSHTSVTPYSDVHDDAAHALCRCLRNGIGCKMNPARADLIEQELRADWDRLDEVLSH